MTFFKDDLIPSCSMCRYATEYIPVFTYPYADPYCSKGHGKCGVDKFCGDFRLINGFYCEDCEFYTGESFCEKKNECVDKFQTSCAYIRRRK